MAAKLTKYPRSILSLFLAAGAISLTSCGTTSNKAPAPPAYTASSLSGGYVFTASGTDPSDGDYAVAGTFQADGKGNITGGIADYNLGSGIDPKVLFTGTYTVAPLGSGTVSITDSQGVQDTFTIYLTNGSTGGVSGVSSFDSTGSGELVPIGTQAASLAGTYSFSLKGESHGTLTDSGTFTTNAAGTIISGTETYSDAGASGSNDALSGYLLPILNGRGYAVIGPHTFGYYLNSLNQITLVGLDDQALLSGTAQPTT
jgi:hypothetical protein